VGEGGCVGASTHRHLLRWLASNLDSPDGFNAYRTEGTAPNGASVIKKITPTVLPETATSYEDPEELPDNVNFTYWTKALFNGVETGPSIFARIKPATNVAPQAANDAYSGSGVIAGSVFGNDTDADIGPNGKTQWTAVLVNASGVPVAKPAALTFPGDGTFSWDTANGSITFYYRIDTGTWTDGKTTVDMSADSNVATVTISAPVPPETVKPEVTVTSITPETIWSPNGKPVAVTIKGTASDASGIATIRVKVNDEYGPNNPDFTLNFPQTGATSVSFSVVVNLTASRLGSDKDGRKYELTVCALDKALPTPNEGCDHLPDGSPRIWTVTAHDKSGTK
jgi:hypothetical protein